MLEERGEGMSAFRCIERKKHVTGEIDENVMTLCPEYLLNVYFCLVHNL